MPRRRAKIFQGIDASPGIHVGLVHLLDRRRVHIPKRHLPNVNLESEVLRFRQAVTDSIAQLESVRSKLSIRGSKEPGAIIDAHVLMMKDEMLIDGTENLIRKQALNAEWALQQVVAEIRKAFDAVEDDYFRERRSDVEFVGERLLRTLVGKDAEVCAPAHDRAVVVSHDLSPADTAALGRDRVAAFVTEVGGKTGHTAIVARALELPAVVGVEGILANLGTGDRIIVDGYRGQVILHPSEQMVREALARSQGLASRVAALKSELALPAETTDGQRIRLAANIEMADELGTALNYGAEAVGLFRTEFMFMGKKAPSEAGQRKVYSKILREMGTRPATIRTMDLGGDKSQRIFHAEPEANPALGLRSIRLSLRHRKAFLTQLRALLRASVEGKLRLIFPMISCQAELDQTLEALDEAKHQLDQKSLPYAEDLEVGIMIEVPSTAYVAELFAPRVDFFSIGTNDLIQYMLAVDRHNEQVAYLYNPLHVAVLRMLHHVVTEAHRAGVGVGMCGEMAGDPLYLHILLGLGLDEISMNPVAMPYVRHLIRHSSAREARKLTRRVLRMETSEEIGRTVRDWMAERFPDFFNAQGHTDLLGGL